MDIRSQLLKENSKKNMLDIANYVGNDAEKFNVLIKLFLHDHYRVTQRAANPVNIVFDRYPEMIQLHIDEVISNLHNNINIAVKRNTLRMLQDIPVPEKHEGLLLQLCFDYLLDKEEPIAVKVFAMTVLSNLAEKYPEIKNELSAVIEELMEFGSAGIRSRGAKTLKKLSKLKIV